MTKLCPACGDSIMSEQSNFCASCGRQIREIPPEFAAMVAPDDQRLIPMPVVLKVAPSKNRGRSAIKE